MKKRFVLTIDKTIDGQHKIRLDNGIVCYERKTDIDMSAFEKCGDVDQAYFMITKIYHESYIGVSLELVKGEIQPCVNRIEGIKEAIKDRDFELRKEIIAAMIGDASHKDFIKRVNSIYNWIKEGKI